MKTHIVQQTKHQLRQNNGNHVNFKKKQVSVWAFSMIRKNKLTKRTTKTEKNKKSWKILKIYNIINFETIRYKLTASGNLIHSILNYKLMRVVITVRVPKE